jgi:hypothetical protein
MAITAAEEKESKKAVMSDLVTWRYRMSSECST